MEHIKKVVELVKEQLLELKSGMGDRKSEIDKEYRNALQVAEANKKAAVTIAEKTRREALKEFDGEEQQIRTLQTMLKSLGASPKPEKLIQLILPTNAYSTDLSVVQKIAFVLDQIGSGYKEDIAKVIAKEDGTDVADVTKKISGVLSSMKSKGQLTAVKDGRRDKYSLVK